MPAVYSAALPGSQCLQDIQAFQVCLKKKKKKKKKASERHSLHKTYQLKGKRHRFSIFQYVFPST